MHGRVKVRTTAEEAEKKKKEQDLKVKLYRIAMKKIHEKRKASNYDEEMLQFMAQVLHKNPDVYTLWNIRKETLKFLLKGDETSKSSDNYLTKENELFSKDLLFTEQCLMVNPKSYGAWHHRSWILENSQKPNWSNELALCTKYLNLDERNFHVWNYRRYVADKANISKDKEFDFCTEKIRRNFSNYSSWHYRSKLLPILHPHSQNKNRPISEEILKSELELVLTAAFTDPNDSSAWFYQRWLLGYSEPQLDIAAFRLSKKKIMISFTKCVSMKEVKVSLGAIVFDSKKWQPCNVGRTYDTMWLFRGCFLVCTKFVHVAIGNLQFELELKKHEEDLYGYKLPKFEYEFGSGVLNVLKEQLNSCEELLEHEPDSKWTLLTAALLMRAIDRKLYYCKSIDYLQKLEIVDQMRVGYYKDLSSKWKIEHSLENCKTIPVLLTLSNLNLTSLFYEQFLCIFDRINLSNNPLNSVKKLTLFHFPKFTVSSELLSKFQETETLSDNVDTIIGSARKTTE